MRSFVRRLWLSIFVVAGLVAATGFVAGLVAAVAKPPLADERLAVAFGFFASMFVLAGVYRWGLWLAEPSRPPAAGGPTLEERAAAVARQEMEHQQRVAHYAREIPRALKQYPLITQDEIVATIRALPPGSDEDIPAIARALHEAAVRRSAARRAPDSI